MTKQTYRFIILLLTGLLALVITWGISFSQDNSEELVLPNSLENIYPLPYDQVPQQATKFIEDLGGIVTSSVSKNTNYLVYGEKAGSKLDKAKKLNVETLTESDFSKLISK